MKTAQCKTKTGLGCGQWLPLDIEHFYRDGYGGFKHLCIECYKARFHEHYHATNGAYHKRRYRLLALKNRAR